MLTFTGSTGGLSRTGRNYELVVQTLQPRVILQAAGLDEETENNRMGRNQLTNEYQVISTMRSYDANHAPQPRARIQPLLL